MDHLSGLFILAFGMSVSVGSSHGSTVDSSQSVTCMEAMTCVPDTDKLTEAITNSRIDEACSILTTSYSCMKGAIDDCRAKNLLTETQLQSMEENYKTYETQLSQYCQGRGDSGGSQAGGLHCMEATSCIPDVDRLTDATTNGRTQEACQILTTSTTCLESAINDCKARGPMSEKDLQSLEQIKASYESQVDQLCRSAGSSGGVGCFQMSTCTPDVKRLNISIENMQYEEACKIVKPALECQTAALEDCKKIDAFDSTMMKEMEKGVAHAHAEMEKYCSSGNSAFTSMLHIFLATLLVFLINFMHPRM